MCVRNKRTIAYCRQKKCHKVPKASPCVECYKDGIPVATCRLEHKHLGCSACITETKVNTGREGETPCSLLCEQNGLPQCCSELVSLTFYTPPETDQKKNGSMQDQATGYLLDFSEARFSQWMKTFELQTQTEYCIQKGSHQNQECNNGLLQFRGKMLKYSTKWSQAYQCKRGGEARHKSEKAALNRNTPGSMKLGCKAFLRVRLLVTEEGEQILELSVPKYSAHCGHNVGSLLDLLTHKPLPEIGKKVEALVRHSRLSQISLHLAVNDWIRNKLIPEHIQNGTILQFPHEHDRRYFPTSTDLRVMTRKALHNIRNGLFDQDAVEAFLQKKRQHNPSFRYFLQKYKSEEHMDKPKESR